jgi:hypothetical protein
MAHQNFSTGRLKKVYVYFENTLATSLFLRSSFSIPEVWGSALLKAEWKTRLGRRQSWEDVKAGQMSMLGQKTTHAGQMSKKAGRMSKLGGRNSWVEDKSGRMSKLGRRQCWADVRENWADVKAGQKSRVIRS